MKKVKVVSLLMFVSILTKPINFFKEITIAALFGAGIFRDAFLVAWQIPNIIGGFIFEGLPQIFVPWLTELRGKENYSKMLNSIFNLFALALFIVSVLVIFNSSFLVSVIAPFLSPATKDLAIKLLKIMAFSIFFMGISAVFTGIIYSYKKFIIPSLTVPLMSLVIIIVVILGYSKYGIYSLACGVLIGSLSMVLLQLFQVKGEKYKAIIIFDEELKKFFLLSGSFFLGTLVFNLNAIVEKIFASTLPIGSISYLDYAFHIIQLFFTISIPVTIVIFPKLCSCSVNPESKKEFVNLISQGLKIIIFFIVPISVILAVLRFPIVKVIYQRGVFTEEATRFTSNLMGIYALGLIPHSLNYMLIHIFYARKEMLPRIKYSLLFLVVSIFLNMIFIGRFGVYGIALSNSLAAIISMVFLTMLAVIKIKIPLKEILDSFCKILLISLATGLIVGKIWNIANLRISLFPGLFVSLLGGTVVFFFGVYFFKIPEIKYVKDLIPEMIEKWKK